MRPGKKLLVLDIDYTLFDHRSTAQTGLELMRPFLHEFLTSAYKVWHILNFIYCYFIKVSSYLGDGWGLSKRSF